MKFSLTVTPGYEGHALEMDVNQEAILLRGAKGQLLGTMPWSGVIDRILSSEDDARFAHSRAHPRAPAGEEPARQSRIDDLGGGADTPAQVPLPAGAGRRTVPTG